MKKPLSLRKYLSRMITYLGAFVLTFLICLALGSVKDVEMKDAILIGLGFGGLFMLLPAAYDLVMYIVLSRKFASAVPERLTVSNWKIGFWRQSGSVIVELDGEEFVSPAFFTRDEAKALVGKTVLAARHEGSLFIYSIEE